jgi:predicted alpha/beta superfamily hydrolase
MDIKIKRILIAAVIFAAAFAVTLLILNPSFVGSIFKPNNYTTVSISADGFVPADENKELTGSNARLIVINDFHATQLDNDRSLHVYLPPSYYKDTQKKYPVLYVHDGKGVFDVSDWSKESMNMHITADRLISEGKIQEIIIVGIDNIGENRVGEYAHWDGIDQGKPVKGVGEKHEDFIINDVKPFIDKNFRTLPDRDNTALMGMSIGGLSTFNVGFRQPQVFSKLAMLSPYLGYGDGKLYNMISEGPYNEKQPFKIWIDVGSKEGDFINMAAQGVYLLMQNGYKYGEDIFAYDVPDGEHSEKYWGQRVEPILLYFFGDIGKPQSVKLYCDNQISLSDTVIKNIDAVVTYDSGFVMTDVMGTYTIEKPELQMFSSPSDSLKVTRPDSIL